MGDRCPGEEIDGGFCALSNRELPGYFLGRKVLRVDKVAGIVEVERADSGHEIVVRHPASLPDASGLCQIVLSPRYARHLAHLLIEHATDAEAYVAGTLDKERHYRQLGHGGKSGL